MRATTRVLLLSAVRARDGVCHRSRRLRPAPCRDRADGRPLAPGSAGADLRLALRRAGEGSGGAGAAPDRLHRLDWDPACLNFYETERAVNTPSTWQVRQPIYASSVGRWRNSNGTSARCSPCCHPRRPTAIPRREPIFAHKPASDSRGRAEKRQRIPPSSRPDLALMTGYRRGQRRESIRSSRKPVGGKRHIGDRTRTERPRTQIGAMRLRFSALPRDRVQETPADDTVRCKLMGEDQAR